jgi:hypothetical protein
LSVLLREVAIPIDANAVRSRIDVGKGERAVITRRYGSRSTAAIIAAALLVLRIPVLSLWLCLTRLTRLTLLAALVPAISLIIVLSALILVIDGEERNRRFAHGLAGGIGDRA